MTTTDILAEYRRLAERLTLVDGSRPLMRPPDAWMGESSGPRLDLRDGQPVVPLDLVLQALRAIKMRPHLAPYMHQQWDVDLAVSYGNGNSENITEAVLVAANAALDAREAVGEVATDA